MKKDKKVIEEGSKATNIYEQETEEEEENGERYKEGKLPKSVKGVADDSGEKC